MSQSFKKTPIISIACCGKGRGMKNAKTCAVRKVRRLQDDDLPDGGYYKKLVERYMWPDDGKQYFDDPKSYRK